MLDVQQITAVAEKYQREALRIHAATPNIMSVDGLVFERVAEAADRWRCIGLELDALAGAFTIPKPLHAEPSVLPAWVQRAPEPVFRAWLDEHI